MIKKFKVDEPNLDLNTNKVEIRKLPPLLKPFDFYKTIEIYLEDVLSKYYIQGKIKERDKEYSRCYLVFRTDQKMAEFLSGYKKIFCDERGQYYKPEIKKSLNQNHSFNSIFNLNPSKNTYLESLFYTTFLEKQESRTQLLQQETFKLSEVERKPGQSTQEDKTRKFEKVKTAIIVELEQDYQDDKRRQLEIEQMQKNVITLDSQVTQKGEKRRRFVQKFKLSRFLYPRLRIDQLQSLKQNLNQRY